MGSLGVSLEELYSIDESGQKEKSGRKKNGNEEERQFKSKNLQAERNRRKKLRDRLLTLRGLVPNITDMNKETILYDAISYITELQKQVGDLSDQLCELEAISSEEEAMLGEADIKCDQEMKSNTIEAEVEVFKMDQQRLWVKLVFQSKKGRFTKLMEAMNFLGLELADTSVTTLRGATIVSSCVIPASEKYSFRGFHGEGLIVGRISDLLLGVVKSI